MIRQNHRTGYSSWCQQQSFNAWVTKLLEYIMELQLIFRGLHTHCPLHCPIELPQHTCLDRNLTRSKSIMTWSIYSASGLDKR